MWGVLLIKALSKLDWNFTLPAGSLKTFDFDICFGTLTAVNCVCVSIVYRYPIGIVFGLCMYYTG